MSAQSFVSIQSTKEKSASFDAVLISRDGHRKALVARISGAALAVVALERLLNVYGVGSSGAFAAVAALALLPWVCAPLYRGRRLTERVRMNNGVIRISRYVQNRLVDQRRFKALGLGVDCQSNAARDCMRIELAARDRTFEIGAHLTPSERGKFLVRFLEALQEAGVDPQIRRTFGPPISSVRRRSRRIGLRSVSRFRLLGERRIGCRHGRAAADLSPPGAPVARDSEQRLLGLDARRERGRSDAVTAMDEKIDSESNGNERRI